MSVHTVSNLETGGGNVTLDTLLKVAGVLGFKVEVGLLAEGAQKERQCRKLHIDENDHFTRLLETSACGAIGAVYVAP